MGISRKKPATPAPAPAPPPAPPPPEPVIQYVERTDAELVAQGWRKATDAAAEIDRMRKQLKDAEERAETHRNAEKQLEADRKKMEAALAEAQMIKLELEQKASAEKARLAYEADRVRRSLEDERERAARLQDALLAT
uniref:Uncharacterized protein n=2 Tax=Haptolina brevifila TaxID=156173 RepID=A0A7S2HYN5_9EUKA|mmetsp:Transcript_5906/g.12424  ORF Transcript_5906/g.12424 Transcript_5906/m.12424 type:complete len:138 (+) Transcript_5906:113-526(+)